MEAGAGRDRRRARPRFHHRGARRRAVHGLRTFRTDPARRSRLCSAPGARPPAQRPVHERHPGRLQVGLGVEGARRRDEDGEGPRTPVKKPQARKDLAKAFLRLAATGKVREAYERFIAAGFRHHNPYFAGDADSLRKGMEGAAAKFPHTIIEFQRALEEGTLVAVHSRVKHEPAGRDIAAVHLFRFKGSKIVELWDVAVEAPPDSPNEHGMFCTLAP